MHDRDFWHLRDEHLPQVFDQRVREESFADLDVIFSEDMGEKDSVDSVTAISKILAC